MACHTAFFVGIQVPAPPAAVARPGRNSLPTSPLSSRSYTQRWYNPLRRRRYNHSPDFVRHWIEAQPPTVASHERFLIVSYNILGDRNASKHKDLYRNVPPLYMKWSHRKSVVCEEILGWSPDLICLQEVDRFYDLLSIMQKAGYIGLYKRRTGDNVDGCAVFWKADKLHLLGGESIEFKRHGLRDNVAQLSVFEMIKTKRRFVVGNIHVLYNPSRGDVKLGQVRMLSSRAHILSKTWGNLPVVLAGDFNSTPESAIYRFLSSSELNIVAYDRRELSGQKNCHPAQRSSTGREIWDPLVLIDGLMRGSWNDEAVKIATGHAECLIAVHPLNLRSSYATGTSSVRDSIGEPLATSYHLKFLGTVDYLWYSEGIIPTRVLDTLPVDVLRKTGGLPCEKLGSDHLALVSEFTFTHQRTYVDDNHTGCSKQQ